VIVREAHSGGSLRTDFCIIGGGPAAIAVALELLKTDCDIVMLVGGGERRESAVDQDLNRGIVPREGSHEGLEENRRRVFGGATQAWGGRCIPFQPIDFEERPWMPYSGWPFGYEAIEDFYHRAVQLCDAGEFEFDARKVFAGAPDEIIPGLDSSELESWHLERWSPPINFSVRYREILEKASNIRVLLDTHLTALCAARAETISGARVVCNGRAFEIHAGQYILATGGIENARILLSSKGPFHPNGLGNDHDLVGRFYMCHPHGCVGALALKNPKSAMRDYERDPDGVYCRRRWWVVENAQRSHRIGNMVFALDAPNPEMGHRDALFSCVYVVKALKAILKARGIRGRYERLIKERQSAKEHLQVVLRGGFKVIPAILRFGRQRLTRGRRLPSVLPRTNAPCWGLFFQAEQAPNPESRITLSPNEVDAHGMPRAVVNLAFSDIDRKTVIEGHRIFLERYQEANAGTAIFDEAALEKFLLRFSERFNSAAHHIGTTRMASTPESGVVDANCRVFGIENLYVTGSSVFPTSGHANPTLTIVALAIRLGEHLAGGSGATQDRTFALAGRGQP
jgi:choline dehydrogenase-like flavoprotein